MGEMLYGELIRGMTWSYSRAECFKDCPYRWFLKYIEGSSETPRFYSSYGSFMHELLERFYNHELKKDELPTEFLLHFSEKVQGERPAASVVQNYIQSGLSFLQNLTPLPFDTVAVTIRGIPVTGFIDYIGRCADGFVIVDHKSRNLKPRSRRKKPTQSDEELDAMLRQLYIYSAAVKEFCGAFPVKLCFNCFRTGLLIEEAFDPGAYDEAVSWFCDKVHAAEDADEFPPRPDWFSCRWICGVHDDCCYYDGR